MSTSTVYDMFTGGSVSNSHSSFRKAQGLQTEPLLFCCWNDEEGPSHFLEETGDIYQPLIILAARRESSSFEKKFSEYRLRMMAHPSSLINNEERGWSTKIGNRSGVSAHQRVGCIFLFCPSGEEPDRKKELKQEYDVFSSKEKLSGSLRKGAVSPNGATMQPL